MGRRENDVILVLGRCSANTEYSNPLRRLMTCAYPRRGQGQGFRINTSQGWKKIKRFKYSLPELEYVHGVLEHLAGKGWKRALPFHLTKDGLPYVETPEGLFYVTSWIQGEEINSDDPFHLEMAAKIIGEMHRLLQDHRGPDNCPRSFPAHWQDKYAGQAEDLERYRQQAESARKGKFGRRFGKSPMILSA